MSQPVWTLVANLGDVNPLEYGGVFVYRDTTGVYPPEMELCEPIEKNEDGDIVRWSVQRLILEPCTYVNGVLSDNRFHPDHAAWFADRLEEVASSIGQDVSVLVNVLCGEDIVERANAYRAIADYHGWINFDSYPLAFTDRTELETRYSL